MGDRSVSLTYYQVARLVVETSGKVEGSKTYDKIINNFVYGNRWQEAIDEELWNLDTHQTWTYIPLSLRQKAIGCKWVFKVKYYLDNSIERYKVRLIAQ